MIYTMAQAKKRSSKKTPAQKTAARLTAAQKRARKQRLSGAAKNAATAAALKRARNPAGIRQTVAARERRRDVQGTVISPSAQAALNTDAQARGFRSADQALRARGARLTGRVSTPAGRANAYAKAGRSG